MSDAAATLAIVAAVITALLLYGRRRFGARYGGGVFPH